MTEPEAERRSAMEKLTFEQINEKNLESYAEFILPVILDELEMYMCLNDEMKERLKEASDYLMIGALADGRPAGAVVAELEAEGDILILSISVDTPLRRQGIGSRLIDKVVQIARASYCFGGETDASPDCPGKKEAAGESETITLKTVYSLPSKQEESFEAFLKGFGFTDYYLDEPFYLIDSELLKTSKLMADKPEAEEKEDEALIQDLSKDMDLVFSANHDEPDEVRAAAYKEEDETKDNPPTYYLEVFGRGEDVSSRLAVILIRRCVRAIFEESENFTLHIENENMLFNRFFEEFDRPGVKYYTRVAMVDVEMQEG